MVELLAPAGSRESLVAAIESGANAVYLAGNMFGARAYASNFGPEELREAIRFAHLRGVAIHVTVNTIVAEDELEQLADYLRFLDEAGADAILVQDLGVARIARRVAPGLALHASTQMSVHSLAGVQAMAELGFTRVVLARELTLDEISDICRHTDIEIEMFMHGALCVCYSGQCLMSSLIGGRSGNRGRCAQPCRLPYTLVDMDDPQRDLLKGTAGQYLLSPRDINTIDILPQVLQTGITSLKIEGRMKRPEYVATVVSTYRKAIDRCYALQAGSDGTQNAYTVPESSHDALRQIFNRDFSTAYMEQQPGHKPGAAMMSDRRPNNRGLLLGRVLSYDAGRRRMTLRLSGHLAVGDQLDIWVKVGGRVAITVDTMTNADGRQITNAEAGETISLILPEPHGQGKRRNGLPQIHEHDRVFKVYDAELMEKAKALYASGAPVRRIGLRAQVRAAIGEPLHLRLIDADGCQAEADTEFIGEPARKRPLTREVISKQIGRMGSSIFELEQLDCDIQGDVMIPMSELNEVRRQAVAGLEKARLARYDHDVRQMQQAHKAAFAATTGKTASADETEQEQLPAAQLMVQVDDIPKLQAALAAGADGILFGGENFAHKAIPAADYERAAELARTAGARIDFALPRIIRGYEQAASEKMLALCDELQPAAVHVHSLGALALAKQLTSRPLHADWSLITYNSEALQFLQEQGVAEATLSPELNLKQIGQLLPKAGIGLSVLAYGRLELMLSEYCVAGSFLGNVGSGHCSGPCRSGQHFALRDRKEALFPLAMDQFCRMHVLNSKPLSMLPHAARLSRLGLTLRLDGRYMEPEEITNLVYDYRKALRLPPDEQDLTEQQRTWLQEHEGSDFTRGHFFRGVE